LKTITEMVHMILAVCFTNFGPYHLSRLRALAARLSDERHLLIAYEVAGRERRYPWARSQDHEPFAWITLFPGKILEELDPWACRHAIVRALDRDDPDVMGIVGYARPESMAAARWANFHDRPAILMSESRLIDRPRVWWKELIKKRRIRRFDSALVGGPAHRDYLAHLGMPPDRVALGYNAVDNDFFASAARAWRQDPQGRVSLPRAPYFLTVCRFVPEKNLMRLITAFARYRGQAPASSAWDLVLAGDGPRSDDVARAIAGSGCAQAIHRAGFLQSGALPRWYAHAAAFVLPSLSEPWGLVVNEAAATGLPLLVSSHAGCATTLVPDPEGTTGGRFDPQDISDMEKKLAWMAGLPEESRLAMGRRAATVVSEWGPDRFARGMIEALELATMARQAGDQRRRLSMKVS
jgi:glycosyltransferase involved in cell wall biosynthesis